MAPAGSRPCLGDPCPVRLWIPRDPLCHHCRGAGDHRHGRRIVAAGANQTRARRPGLRPCGHPVRAEHPWPPRPSRWERGHRPRGAAGVDSASRSRSRVCGVTRPPPRVCDGTPRPLRPGSPGVSVRRLLRGNARRDVRRSRPNDRRKRRDRPRRRPGPSGPPHARTHARVRVLLLGIEGLLFSGDAIQGRGSPAGAWPLYVDAAAYQSSLDRLSQLQVQTLALGHGFQSGLPLNWPVKRGSEVDAFVPRISRGQSGDCRCRSRCDRCGRRLPATSMSRSARCTELLGRIPTRIESDTLLPGIGGHTLGTYPGSPRLTFSDPSSQDIPLSSALARRSALSSSTMKPSATRVRQARSIRSR